MSLQALCGSPWFLTSAVVVTTSVAMLYRRVVISYGRAQSLRAAFFLLLCFGLMLVFNFPFHLRHSIYDITEGKTSGPWRPEWGFHKPNTTAHTDAAISAYIHSLAKKHALPPSIPFIARRLQPKPSSSAPPFLSTTPFLPRTHTFSPTFTPGAPLRLPIPRPPSSPPGSSNLLIAISTTPSRLTSLSLPHLWSPFLTGPSAPHLLLLLHGAAPSDLLSANRTLLSLGIKATIAASSEHSHTGGRYAQLMQRLMHVRVDEMLSPPTPPNEKTGWFALLNDDVFLPRPASLLRALGSLDSTSEVLIRTAAPGAVFFTAGVLDVLGQLLCLQDAKKGENDGLGPEGWGGKLVECLSPAGVETKVLEEGMVMRGEPGVGYLVTEACKWEGCFGGRWGFGDGWVVEGGVRVVEFLDGRVVAEEDKGEVGVLREGGKRIKMEGRRRRTWKVLDGEVKDGEVWQAYVRRKGRGDLVKDGDDDGEEVADGDSLVLLIWEKAK